VARCRLSNIHSQLRSDGEALVNPAIFPKHGDTQRSRLEQRFGGDFDAMLDASTVGEGYEARTKRHRRKRGNYAVRNPKHMAFTEQFRPLND
jgi:hypothetical protein